MKTFIIKPVSYACNLRCDYCYAAFNNNANNALIKRMDEATLVRFYSLVTPQSHIIWHGGEPLLRGTSFYERALELGKKKHLTYSLTTNATLMTPAWASFFKKSKSHNETFDAVMRGVMLAKLYKLNFELNAVVTTDTLKENPKKLYRFFVSVWNRFSFAPCWERGLDGKLSPYVIPDKVFLGYIKKVFDVWWEEDNPAIKIELFESLISGVLGKNPGLCMFSRHKCADYLSIEPNGDIYPCGRYNGIEAFKIGNINTMDFEAIRKTRQYILYLRNSHHLSDACRACTFRTICNNACVYERWNGTSFDDTNPYCNTWQGLLTHIKEKIIVSPYAPNL